MARPFIGKKFKQRSANHVFWGCFGRNHALYGRLISKVSAQPQRWDRKEEERTSIKGSRTKKELESSVVKQLAEKLAMAADLLKYSPHFEITDAYWGICVNICNLLLSMPFLSCLSPIHSNSLPGHPFPESSSSFPKRGLAPPHPAMVIHHFIPKE